MYAGSLTRLTVSTTEGWKGDDMKRLVTVIAIGFALLACASTAAWAVPTNGNNSGTLTLSCGGETVTVLALPGESSPVWQVDESGLIGTKYHVQSLDIRVYST